MPVMSDPSYIHRFKVTILSVADTEIDLLRELQALMRTQYPHLTTEVVVLNDSGQSHARKRYEDDPSPGRVTSNRYRMFQQYAVAGDKGLTDWAAASGAGLLSTSYSTRGRELRRRKLIAFTGERRRDSPDGPSRAVSVVTPYGLTWTLQEQRPMKAP